MWTFKKKKPPIKENLLFAFKDLDGKNYYRFNDPADISMERTAAMLRFDIELIKGITDSELEELLAISDAHLFNAAKDKTALVKAAGVNHEIRLRKKQISNVNIYYNLFAVNYIREDEKPDTYNIQCQKEKVEAFRKGSTQQGSFFFALPELKTLCKRLNILTENWDDIMIQSDMAQERNQEAIRILK